MIQNILPLLRNYQFKYLLLVPWSSD